MERPKITNELIQTVAADFCERNEWDDARAKDLVHAAVRQCCTLDGYELAKALEEDQGWTINAQDVASLDRFACDVRDAHRALGLAWARDNNVQPPLPIGAMTTYGEITEICDYYGATYLVREPDDPDPTRRLLIRFEDAHILETSLNSR